MRLPLKLTIFISTHNWSPLASLDICPDNLQCLRQMMPKKTRQKGRCCRELALAAGCPPRSALDYYAPETEWRLWMVQRSRDSIMCIQPDSQDSPACSLRCYSPRIRRRKADHGNLRLLRRLSQVQWESLKFRMALTNARSLINKTFICNDLFQMI